MDESLECIEDTQADLVQEITDATCSGSRVLLDTDYNQINLELTAEEWMQLFSCILTGGDIVYPEISHDLHWKWVKALECAMTFCEKMADCISSSEEVRVAMINYGVMLVGMIVAYVSQYPPAGTLDCDGAHYLKSDMPELWARLGATFEVDTLHFRLPNIAGQFLLGGIYGTYEIDATGGEASHVLTVPEIPSHNHLYTRPNDDTGNQGSGTTTIVGNVSGNIGTTNTGGGEAHNNMPPYYVVRYAIVTGLRS